LDEKIITFVGLLRQNGVRVSVAESMETFRALDLVGLGARQPVKDVLRTTLVKRAVDVPTFDTLFDLYFSGLGEIVKQSEQSARDALDLDGADLVVGTGGKCIQAFPGLAFVLVRNEVMARLADHPRRSLYLSLPVHWQAQERGTVPFTPAVQLAYALEEALAELLEESVPGRVARYAAAASLLRDGFARLGLRFVLPPERRSNSPLLAERGRAEPCRRAVMVQRILEITLTHGRVSRERAAIERVLQRRRGRDPGDDGGDGPLPAGNGRVERRGAEHEGIRQRPRGFGKDVAERDQPAQ